MSAALHPFERAGLGKAPFRCVGVRENWFEMPGFGRKPGGSCNYCGTGILHEFVIASEDGAEFVVGSDCVERTGALVSGFREARLARIRERRAVGVSERQAERDARWKSEREERHFEKAQDWEAANPALLARLKAYTGQNEFVRSMIQSLNEWGGLTLGQTIAVTNSIDIDERREAARANAKHVGTIGKRMQANVRVVFSKLLWQQHFPTRCGCLTILETEAGETLVWFSADRWHVGGGFFPCKFTPSEHGERDGVLQTVIKRPARVEERQAA